MRTYAAHIVDNQVTEVIVGTAEWATDNLGGQWVDSPVKVGIGWTFHGDHFRHTTTVPVMDLGQRMATTDTNARRRHVDMGRRNTNMDRTPRGRHTMIRWAIIATLTAITAITATLWWTTADIIKQWRTR
jgi:hypothetical protein